MKLISKIPKDAIAMKINTSGLDDIYFYIGTSLKKNQIFKIIHANSFCIVDFSLAPGLLGLKLYSEWPEGLFYTIKYFKKLDGK